MKKIVGVLVPIYNRIEITKVGLRSVYKALEFYNSNADRHFDFRIIVIDDGSTDGSSEWIKTNYPETIVLKGDGNLWWSGAINLGAHYSVEELKASFILLWNDDVEIRDDYFKQMEDVVLSGSIPPDSIYVSKVYWLHDPEILFNYGCFYDPRTGKKVINGYDQKDSADYNRIMKVDWSAGMGTLIPSTVLQEVGYFDAANFPQYDGDSDFFLRAKAKGFDSYVFPSLKLWCNKFTTGFHKIDSFSDIKDFLTSNRSNWKLSQTFAFNRRHSNTLRSWVGLANSYCRLLLRMSGKVLLHKAGLRKYNRS